MSFTKDREISNDAEIGEAAAEWLLSFDAADPDVDNEYPDEKSRNEAFYEWLETSPDHLRVFLETVETLRRARMIDAHHLIEVETLLRNRADVIPLWKAKPAWPAHRAENPSRDSVQTRWPRFASGMAAKRVTVRATAAAIMVFALGIAGYWWSSERNTYATQVGEQRSTKLEDGSFIYLNTDSKVEVHFSRQARNVRLVRGEALFVVEHDSSKPFTVTTGETAVRAIGTQFNVRQRAQGAEVAVVEGTVQVTVLDKEAGFPAQQLVAGEGTQVSRGKIGPKQGIAEALAWRQRRFVFHDTRLADVAEEFNRYNRTKIRVEGDAAKEMLLSGIFEADRPQALMLYAAKTSELAVEPQGNDWVIRSR